MITRKLSNRNYHFDEYFEWDEGGKILCFMLLNFAVFTILFILLQFKVVKRRLNLAINNLCSRKKQSDAAVPLLPANMPVCPNVEQEEKFVKAGNLDGCVLVVDGMTKRFGKFTAVDELYLTVKQNECFGLLGVNGAGKTTTFDILTGQTYATEGTATIDGEPVHNEIAIGYCPQFDAMMADFTAFETLKILALLFGFKQWRAKVDCILECVDMTKHANKKIMRLSGGQKRKISMGIALLAPTKIIILDEPTAGIDPIARRGLWNLLLWVREHVDSAIMLTSHSMEECEALCSRIGVLKKGKLIAIGTSQDLKSLYGKSYSLSMTLANQADRERVASAVVSQFPGSILKTQSTNMTMTLEWEIPKHLSDKWSDKYREVERLAASLQVRDYCLTQSSLEDTFLRLSGVLA